MIGFMVALGLASTPAEAETVYRWCLRSWAPERELAEDPPIVLFGRAVEACKSERAEFVDSVDLSRPDDGEHERTVARSRAEWKVGDVEAEIFRDRVRSRFELSVHEQSSAPLAR